MPKIFDVVKAMGTYTDGQGQEKTRWQNCGMIIKNSDSGKCSLKLSAIPYGIPDDEGWFALMEPKPRPQQIPTSQPAQATGTLPDEDIPF